MIPGRADGARKLKWQGAAGDAPDPALGTHSYAVQREAVIAMLERERRSLTSSLIALALLAIGVSLLPDPGPMFALLALRGASFIFTRNAASELERRVRASKPLATARLVLVGAMSLTGITLGLLLWPQPADAPPLAVALIQVVVLVAVTLISVTLAALPRARDAMLATFCLTTCALVLLHPEIPASLALVAIALVSGVRVYSANTGQHIVNAASVLVENRKLSEELADALARAEYLSSRDPLTELYNRHKLFEVGRSDSPSKRRTLLTIDLDHFKAINDCFGHGVGDKVLVAAAQTIRAWVGGLAVLREPHCFRLGGEEFLVIIEDLGDEELIEQADLLRRRIKALEDKFPDCPSLVVSASIGLASWHPGEALEDALVRADLACYQAKGRGRNQVARAA